MAISTVIRMICKKSRSSNTRPLPLNQFNSFIICKIHYNIFFIQVGIGNFLIISFAKSRICCFSNIPKLLYVNIDVSLIQLMGLNNFEIIFNN